MQYDPVTENYSLLLFCDSPKVAVTAKGPHYPEHKLWVTLSQVYTEDCFSGESKCDVD